MTKSRTQNSGAATQTHAPKRGMTDHPALTEEEVDAALDQAIQAAQAMQASAIHERLTDPCGPYPSSQPDVSKTTNTTQPPNLTTAPALTPEKPDREQPTLGHPAAATPDHKPPRRKSGVAADPSLRAPGRPKGVLVGKAKLRRIERERAIAAGTTTAPAPQAADETPRDFFRRMMNDVAKSEIERMQAAKLLASLDARSAPPEAIETVNWDRLTSAQRKSGRQALQHYIDLRHISRGRQPEFGTV